MTKAEYFERLEKMIAKVKDLKEWARTTDDKETKSYLNSAIQQLYAEMRELINERTKKK